MSHDLDGILQHIVLLKTYFLLVIFKGHMELKLCRYDGNTDQACLDAHKAHFVRNNDGFELPKDPNYPERAYFAE